MAESYATTSLDYWRKFFKCADADIFEVIKHAILVACADYPTEFLSWRDKITEISYTLFPTQCSSDRVELQTPVSAIEDVEGFEGILKESKENKRSSREENATPTSNEPCTSNGLEYANLDEFEALTDEIEEEQQIFGEVVRINDVLANWKEESDKVLSESLRRLQLMELSIETLEATKIGRVVKVLEKKHKSKPIQQLAKTLVKGWKILAEEWIRATRVSQEPTPVSVAPSPAEEESLLPSELDFPPLDMGAILATQTATFEFSNIFDGMDEDGNIASTREVKKDGRTTPQNRDRNLVRDDSVEARRQQVPRATRLTDTIPKPSKPKDIPRPPKPENPSQKATPPVPKRPSTKATTCSNTQQRHMARDQSGELRKVVPVKLKPIDASRKASKPQDIASIHAPGRPSLGGTVQNEQREKPVGVPSRPGLSRRDAPKETDESFYRHKLEATKRKLHDQYQRAEDAKRQRTIQVMELKDLPKQDQNKQQPTANRGSQFKNFAKRKLR